MENFKNTRLFAYESVSKGVVDVYTNCYMLKRLPGKFDFGQHFDQISVDHIGNTIHFETSNGDEIYKTSSDILYLE